MTHTSPPAAGTLPLRQMLICGALIVTLSMGIRHSFGLWLQPITLAHGWTREDYSVAMAVQNLVWGAAGPLVGWWADRSGAFRVLWLGALLYALGLFGMATTSHHLSFVLTCGVTIGLAQACTTYAVIYGVVGRNIDASQRSWAMGITAAAGSFGQFLMVPLASTLIHKLDWSPALSSLSFAALLIGPLAFGLREARRQAPAVAPSQHGKTAALLDGTPVSAGAALKEAFGHRDYLLLTAGYFVCGFQLAFIGVHLPSYLRDHRLDPQVATTALALIGLFNVFGTYAAGTLGQRIRKTWILSFIYAMRGLAMIAFVFTPPTPLSVGLFAATMGALWLSTVPPTNAVVAQMLGVKHLSMLGGIVFFSHQIGSFMGVWLAGRLYDATGSYQVVWWIAIVLAFAAALINLPIREQLQPARRLVSA
ncbi:MFS transporter [Aquabacterium sp.]|uniref:MFS transporter n=1 Tax=Aquabacterium sp. TaxID=1872578 RepID=UPI002488A2B0|nr:MFS transporter [Aquabacterium sp.]MDI1350731.1 MFS transporter [Aquabacterium sp.]